MNKKIHIFIVNLERDIAKKEAILREVSSVSSEISYSFWPAVDGSLLSEEEISECYDDNKSRQFNNRSLSRGEIGCTLSHLAIYKHLLSENIEKAVIMEDDVVLSNDFSEIVTALITGGHQYDCALLGYHCNQHTEKKSRTSIWGKLKINDRYSLEHPVQVCYGTYSYIVNLSWVRKVINEIASSKIYKPIDHYTGDFSQFDIRVVNERLVRFHPKAIDHSSIGSKERELNRSFSIRKYLRKLVAFRFCRDLFWNLFFSIKSFFSLRHR